MELEDLLDALDKLGVTKEDLENALKDLGKSADPEEIAEAIGKVIGKFGGGVVTGASGVDPDLIKALLDLFGPAALGLLKELMEAFLGEEKGFITSKVDGRPWKRVRIKKDIWISQENYAPDLIVKQTPEVVCEDGVLTVKMKMAIMRQDEVIKLMQLTGYSPTMKPTTLTSEVNGNDNMIVKANGKEDEWEEFELSFRMPCELAILNGGEVMVQYTVSDVDGNYTTDFENVLCREALLDPDSECCKTLKTDDIKTGLMDTLLDALKGAKFGLDDLLEKVTDPAEGEETAPTKPKSESGAMNETEAENTETEVAATLPRRVVLDMNPEELELLRRITNAAIEGVSET